MKLLFNVLIMFLQRPLLHVNILHHLNLSTVRYIENWVNSIAVPLLDDGNKLRHRSFDDCARSCYGHESCFQFTFKIWGRTGQCSLVKTVQQGQRKHSELFRGKQVSHISGWNVDLIQEFLNENECTRESWPSPSTDRLF